MRVERSAHVAAAISFSLAACTDVHRVSAEGSNVAKADELVSAIRRGDRSKSLSMLSGVERADPSHALSELNPDGCWLSNIQNFESDAGLAEWARSQGVDPPNIEVSWECWFKDNLSVEMTVDKDGRVPFIWRAIEE